MHQDHMLSLFLYNLPEEVKEDIKSKALSNNEEYKITINGVVLLEKDVKTSLKACSKFTASLISNEVQKHTNKVKERYSNIEALVSKEVDTGVKNALNNLANNSKRKLGLIQRELDKITREIQREFYG